MPAALITSAAQMGATGPDDELVRNELNLLDIERENHNDDHRSFDGFKERLAAGRSAADALG